MGRFFVVLHDFCLEHRAKKWAPVFRKSDATTNNESKMPLQNERILL
jgi:hypothetical protein